MKTLIDMKCLILWIQPQCLGAYCGNVRNILSLEKLMLYTYYFGVTQRAFGITMATIISNNSFWQRKHKCLDVSRVNVSVAIVMSSMDILLLCFCPHDIVMKINISIMSVPDCTLWIYPPYSKSLHVKNQMFWDWQVFLIICPLQPWLFLTPKAARRTTSGKFSSGSSWVQGGEQSIGTSSCAIIALAFFICLPRPTYIFLLTTAFFCFFFTQMFLYTCLSLHGHVPGTTGWNKN